MALAAPPLAVNEDVRMMQFLEPPARQLEYEEGRGVRPSETLGRDGSDEI